MKCKCGELAEYDFMKHQFECAHCNRVYDVDGSERKCARCEKPLPCSSYTDGKRSWCSYECFSKDEGKGK